MPHSSSEFNVALKLAYAYRIWAFVSVCAMFTIAAFGRDVLKHDENYHIELTKMAIDQGLLSALQSPKNPSAAGALYPILHMIAEPLTALQPRSIRILQVTIFLGIVYLLHKVLGLRLAYPEQASLSIIGVPFLWRTSVLALTEIPALLFFSLFVYLLLKCVGNEEVGKRSLPLAICCGLALGLSILGRQTYLVTFPALAIAVFFKPKEWKLLGTISVAALITCSWLFVVYGGLVPPSQGHTDQGINFFHGLLGLGYLGIASLIMNPRQMKGLTLKYIIFLTPISFLLATITTSTAAVPAQTILGPTLGPDLAETIKPLLYASLFMFALNWLYSWVVEAWKRRTDTASLAINLCTIALALSPLKVTHLFSSRYVVGTLVIEQARAVDYRPSWGHLVLLAITTCFGVISAIAQLG